MVVAVSSIDSDHIGHGIDPEVCINKRNACACQVSNIEVIRARTTCHTDLRETASIDNLPGDQHFKQSTIESLWLKCEAVADDRVTLDQQDVETSSARNRIIAVSSDPGNDIIARSAVNHISPKTTRDIIVAIAAGKRVS